jgi:uncharacterized protein YbjT (DUF2867 family)
MNLVIGASGTLGGRVARRLLELGEPVRAVSRDPSRLGALASSGAEVIAGDLLREDWLPGALAGVRRVVLAAQGFFPPSRQNNPERADEAGNRRVIDAAAGSGVERVVFVSMAAAGPGSPALFGRLKHRVEAHLASSGLSHAIVRPTTFMESHALILMGEPLRAGKKVTLLGDGTTRTNWIAADDVADYVVRALLDGDAVSGPAVIGGPDTLNRLEVLAILERVLGREAKRSHVPLAVLRGARVLVGSWHPGVRYLLDFAITDAEGGASPEWSSPRLDWTAPTQVEDVIRRWAETAPVPAH